MKSEITSYTGLFGTVERVEIPLIQRDYAQGRGGEAVERIRASFLDVLHRAVTGGEPVSLDFVYGDVEGGALRPLDGQQRLTTLFLLHWYIAARADRLSAPGAWKRFSYATRASSRLFCERLVECRPPGDVERLSDWLVDEAWFLRTWMHDPTVQSMLVVLDAIHDRFRNVDCAAAWVRLVDDARPAIAFHLLPVEGMGLGEDLYIKMNSRGKPLTPFENFKARFLQLLESWCKPARLEDIALKLDGTWSDVLWAYRGDDDIVDDELMRYFHFVTEICEWMEGIDEGDNERRSVDVRAEHVFGPANPKRQEHLDFLVAAFDAWVDKDVASLFEALFTKSRDGSGRVVLFGTEGAVEVDLFAACVRGAGEWTGKKRVFALPETLLLYGVLVARIEASSLASSDITRRLRVVRNLVEASSNEVRGENMRGLLEDVRRIVVGGTLDAVTTFNTSQVAEERRKRELLATTPSLEPILFALEDHPVLRGTLAVLDLEVEPDVLERRAGAFHRVFSDPTCWPALTGALLAVGDYARRYRTVFQLGSGVNEAPWREVFTAPAARSPLDRTRAVLASFLDKVAKDAGEHHASLARIQSEWLTEQNAYDWRSYFVKYPAMREGHSGIYVSATETLGFDVCMLDKRRLTSNYRDPYLHAIWRASGVGDSVEKMKFTGYATEPRCMRLVKSGIEMRCVEEGIALRNAAAEHAEAFDRVCGKHGVHEDRVLRVEQEQLDGRKVDTRDRVELAAALLRELVDSGL
jgi:hypothetical protein